MPIPGPRTQFGPLPGYDNPGLESPDRINLWHRPGPVAWPGRTPALMVITLRGCVLAAGQVRHLWRQAVNFIPAQAAYSWTDNDIRTDVQPVGGVGITRALRYRTLSLYMPAGDDNTRLAGLHTVIPTKNRSPRITLGTGVKRGRPTTRNRVSSFGSRVPSSNPPVDAATTQ